MILGSYGKGQASTWARVARCCARRLVPLVLACAPGLASADEPSPPREDATSNGAIREPKESVLPPTNEPDEPEEPRGVGRRCRIEAFQSQGHFSSPIPRRGTRCVGTPR